MGFLRRRRPRFWILSGIAGAVVLVVVAFVVVYVTQLGGSNVAPLALSPAATASPGPSLTTAQLTGTWKIGNGSVAGYRVREQLAFLQSPSDAVGRTSEVSGSMTIGGGASALSVTAARFTVNVATLTSDRSQRDQRIHELGLESDRYPTATFVLATPIALPVTATSGTQFHVNATGDLTIHGTTKRVTIPLTARVSGSSVEIVGSTAFPFEAFGMQVPNVAGFVSVVDSATMEFDLHLTHA